MLSIPLSILDLAYVGEGETPRESLEGSVRLAQAAEALGYRRVWYAEHHNIDRIASSAPAVLIAHIAAHTKRIRLGAGGVMLPNHAPLVVAEQFGTLATLHPDRIDLGLGRAPGTDPLTVRALRRDPRASERFADDVRELQGYLTGDTRVAHVYATPGRGTRVPLYILGSSTFGATLAAQMGLPFAFASHFAPVELMEALRIYRAGFTPSAQCDRPWVIAGVNVLGADTEAEALRQREFRRRAFAKALLSRPGHPLGEAELDAVLRSPHAETLDKMLVYTALGPPPALRAWLEGFVARTGADELMVAHQGDTVAARLRSVELLAEA